MNHITFDKCDKKFTVKFCSYIGEKQKAVLYIEQELTIEQQAQARENIHAASKDIESYIPASTTEENKLVNDSQLRAYAATKTIESYIPSDTSSSNKLVNTKQMIEYSERKNGYYKKLSKLDGEDYAYEAWYDYLNYEYAEEELNKDRYSMLIGGGCSSIAKGNVLARNFDWNYDNLATFVVHTPRANGRYATTTTCGLLANLKKDFVDTRAYSKDYILLPFLALDGANEYGLGMSVNIVPAEKGDNSTIIPYGEIKKTLNSNMVIRYILDNFKTAEDAKNFLLNNCKIFVSKKLKEMHFDMHYIIREKNKQTAYVIEFVNGRPVVLNKNYITNFPLEGVTFNPDGTVYTPLTQTSERDAISYNNVIEHGEGLERYNIIVGDYDSVESTEDMMTLLDRLKYTKLYTQRTWFTELTSGALKVNTPPEDFNDAMQEAVYEYDHRSRSNPTTWQTCHQSVYDLITGTLYSKYQEGTALHVIPMDISESGKVDGANLGEEEVPIVDKVLQFPPYPTKESLGIDQLESGLETERRERMYSDSSMQSSITSLINGLSNEISRASQAEMDIQNSITVLAGEISNEISRASQAEADLLNDVDSTNNRIDELVTEVNDISRNLSEAEENIEEIENDIDIDVNYKSNQNLLSYNGDTVTITERYKNIKNGSTSTRTENIELANETSAGLMPPATVLALQQMRSELDQLEGQSIRLDYSIKDNPTASEIGTFVVDSGYTRSQFPTIGVVVKATNHVWRWYNNTDAWQDVGVDTVNQFTNAIPGTIKGSLIDGQIYAEDDGTGSVNGWSDLNNTVSGISESLNSHENDETNPHNVTKSQVGLGNVDNTSDADKPISTATQTALNGKQNVIDTAHKLSSDLVDDTNKTNKFVTSAEKTTWNGKQNAISDLDTIRSGATAGATALQPNDVDQSYSATSQNPQSGTAVAEAISTALPASTKYASDVSVTMSGTTYVVTIQLKDQDGNNIGTAQTIDLPLESVVVDGRYDATTKKVILTLQNGSTIEFSVADLISGLQAEITASNKLSSDLVDDTGHTNKFVTSSEKAQITTNKDNIASLDTSKADDADVVHKTGNEEINGTKTFKQSIYLDASTPFIIGKNGKGGFRAVDNSNTQVGQMNISDGWYGNGRYGVQISALDSVENKHNQLRVSHNGPQYVQYDNNAGTETIKDLALEEDIPTTASQVNALPDTTKYGAGLSLTISQTDYVITAQLKDQDGNNIGTAQTIDLPLESVVVDGRYDATTKKVILTLQNGNTIEFSVADLVSGLASQTSLDAHTSNTSNPHQVTKSQVGLGNVDNTSDADKPISTATQTALNGKVAKSGDNMSGNLVFDNGVGISAKSTSGTALSLLSVSGSDNIALGNTSLGYIGINNSIQPSSGQKNLIDIGKSGTQWRSVYAKNIYQDGTKVQNAISDLETIRSGATAGATALQPSDIDQTYSATSQNAQSGVAVAQALASVPGGVTEISTQYVRITDLNTGVYKLTYNGTKYLYYNGSASMNSTSVTGGAGAVILVVSKNKSSYWHWYYINGGTSYSSINFGYTSTSSGEYTYKALNSLITTVDQSYSGMSQNPQSGTAVAQALAMVLTFTPYELEA